MTQAMTQETTGKVMSLLGAAMLSMAFLVGVAYSNASFQGTEIAMPNPFAPEKVMAAVDNTANAYSNFLYANVFDSSFKDFALAADNISWIGSNAKDGALAMLGVQEQAQPTLVADLGNRPTVAGAYTSKLQEQQGGFLQTLYSLIAR